MSKTALKVTQASLNQTALDWPQNMANHYRAIDVAVEQGSDMVLMNFMVPFGSRTIHCRT